MKSSRVVIPFKSYLGLCFCGGARAVARRRSVAAPAVPVASGMQAVSIAHLCTGIKHTWAAPFSFLRVPFPILTLRPPVT